MCPLYLTCVGSVLVPGGSLKSLYVIDAKRASPRNVLISKVADVNTSICQKEPYICRSISLRLLEGKKQIKHYTRHSLRRKDTSTEKSMTHIAY